MKNKMFWIVGILVILILAIIMYIRNAVKVTFQPDLIQSLTGGSGVAIAATFNNMLPFRIDLKDVIIRIKVNGVEYYKYDNTDNIISLNKGDTVKNIVFKNVKPVDFTGVFGALSGKVTADISGSIFGIPVRKEIIIK